MKKVLVLFFVLLLLGSKNIFADNNKGEINDIRNENTEKVEKKESENIEYKSIKTDLKLNLDEVEFTLDSKISTHYNPDFNQFIYITSVSYLREKPNLKSKIIKKVRPREKFKLLDVIENIKTKERWYKVYYKDRELYFLYSKAKVRGFNWQKAITKANKINSFIKEAISNNQKIYVINKYVPLNTDKDGKVDIYNNPSNQSVRAYYDQNKYINLPDRSLFIILSEDDNQYEIKTLSYGDKKYIIKKSNKKYIKEAKIENEVNKFIYVDRKSQTEIAIEKNKETGIYNVNAMSFVTTGIEKGKGFITPYGDFLVAYTKPLMLYTSDENTEEIEIVGDAKNPIRFSGGGYLHGIPAKFDPSETKIERKKYTESLLGTVPLSHKCVRNPDDIIKYLYDWVNGSNKKQKNGFTYPEENVIVIVD